MSSNKENESSSDSFSGGDRSSLISSSANNVPVWKKLAYAVGAMPYAMCMTLINLYFSIFLLEVVLVS